MDSPEEQTGGVPPPATGVSAETANGNSRPLGSDTANLPVPAAGGGRRPPPPPPPSDNGGDEDDEGMLRMSFLEHLEELRSRLIKCLIGIAVAFFASLTFASPLWTVVSKPARSALITLGYPPDLVQITPMEAFNTIWVKLPILCAIFIASPWVLYQVWAFISPGLYRRERRWAVPFIASTAGLFMAGGLFAYFVAFRYGLTFLLGIGQGNYVKPMVSISEYSDMFVNVILGVGIVFELPVLIFFLTLLRVVNPQFLLKHTRYAILIIFIIAAIVTPTPDIFNMMLFATPMCMLFFVGIFASHLLVLSRQGRHFPWRKTLIITFVILVLLAGVLYVAMTKYGVRLVPHWPFIQP